MRLARFMLDNLDAILQEWEDFARTLAQGSTMSVEALRNDAERMLRFVAADMETQQTRQQEMAKANGHGPSLPPGQSSAAEHHGVARAVERFSLVELVSEYRALRASVTRMWIAAVPLTHESVAQLVRFNEGIDQILAEGVAKFTERLDHEADLFTASVGHDLSNPLNAVVASARVLAISPTLSDGERAVVERIERASQRLSGMLADLRDFTR
ncbi:MAG TPA: histidine kinase dimerization/phospho-acceptor domain-containing protein, partial [Albitalea sp.]|nr:histidine kinase dimerization/phospho-acceptor domain-containing protein [Albitalea sp.]